MWDDGDDWGGGGTDPECSGRPYEWRPRMTSRPGQCFECGRPTARVQEAINPDTGEVDERCYVHAACEAAMAEEVAGWE